MKTPFLASFIILLLVISHLIRKSKREMEAEEKSFWDKEQEANNVRKQSLEDLNYITIPFETLPCDTHKEHDTIQECLATLHTLSERKIVNLTGITNTELKLTYGTANITVLTEYDQNFTVLVTTLQKWAKQLYKLKAIDEAQTILEYAVSIDSDVIKTYMLLSDIYASKRDAKALAGLMEHASELKSSSGRIILRKLWEKHLHR